MNNEPGFSNEAIDEADKRVDALMAAWRTPEKQAELREASELCDPNSEVILVQETGVTYLSHERFTRISCCQAQEASAVLVSYGGALIMYYSDPRYILRTTKYP